LTLTNERADVMHRTSVNLKKLLEEREEIIRQLTVFNKTAGMGALVASLAHELTQPLAVIQINTDMIGLVLNDHDAKLNQDTNIDKALTGLRKANQRAVTIISTLRNMFGNGRKSISIFDFNVLVQDVLLLCQSTLQRHSIDLQVNLDPQTLRMTGDKSQMQQVILNLMTNASEAFPASFQGDKRISVQTQMVKSHIVLTVADNGMGIDPEIETMVFELLRTNKDTGMGIGLWLSKAIVESHQGKINFTTALTRGTTFRVELPSNSEKNFF
jgi:signal transduction histidine kinase